MRLKPSHDRPLPPPPPLSSSTLASLARFVRSLACREEIVAFLHDYESHYYMLAAESDFNVVDRFLVDDEDKGAPQGRSHVFYTRKKVPKGRYRDRSTCSLATCGLSQDTRGL